MKDILDKIRRYLPQYLIEFGAVFSGPKTFIEQRDTNSDETFSNALLFLGMSLALMVVMVAPLRPAGRDLWNSVAMVAAVALISVVLLSAAIRIGWWIVGGRASARSFFVTYSYFFGVAIVISTGFALVSIGIVKFFDPGLHGKLIEAGTKNQPILVASKSESMLINVYLLVNGIGAAITSIWMFIGWGAYRQLNGLGIRQSLWAAVFSGMFAIPVVIIVHFIASAFRP